MSHTLKIKRKDGEGYWTLSHLDQSEIDDLTDGGFTELHRHYSQGIQVDRKLGSTYSTLQDFIDTTQGSGLLTGGEITDGGSGTVDVTAGTAMIRDVDDPTATILFIDFPAKTGLVLTNDILNIIYVDYNNGSPTVLAGTDLYTHVDETTQIVIGLVYREDNDIHISRTGQILSRLRMRQWLHNLEHHWFHRTAGIATSHTGTRNLAITAGVAWFGFYRLETPAFDSSGTDRFDYYYRSATPGQWTVVTDQSQIDNTYWDDGTGTLNDLTVNRYGNHWVYMVTDGDVYVVYGRGDYTLAQAQAATPPADLPDELSSIGMLVAKIIIQKSASSFVQVYLPWVQSLGFSAASDHGSLAGLGDPEDHTWAALVDGTRAFTGTITVPGLTFDDILVIDSILDQDDFYSDSDTALATQQSIKAYIDSAISGLSIGNYALLDGSNQPFTGALNISMTDPQMKFSEDASNYDLIKRTSSNDQFEIGHYVGGVEKGHIVFDSTGGVGIQGDTVVNIDASGGLCTINATGFAGTVFKDEDNMTSNSATHLCSQQSIKAYVDNKNYLDLGSILTSNGTYVGTKISVTVDDASTVFGNVLAQAADFHYDRSDADAAANSVGLVMALESGSGTKEVLIEGQVCNTAWNWSAGLLYLSTTTGAMTQTAPSGTGDQVVAVGWALSADTIYFKPSLVLVEVA